MYLFRAPNCTYYTRICLPKNLRDRGFPFDLKISLLTKSRPIAIKRNVSVANMIMIQLDNVTPDIEPNAFKECTDKAVDELRSKFHAVEVAILPVRADNKLVPRGLDSEGSGITLLNALEQFIASKLKGKLQDSQKNNLTKARIEMSLKSYY